MANMVSTLVADTKVIVDAAATVAVMSPWAAANPTVTAEKAVSDAHVKMAASHALAKTAADKLTVSAKA